MINTPTKAVAVRDNHALVSFAEKELEPQGKRAINGMIEVLKFYALVAVLKAEAEAAERIIPQVEEKIGRGRPTKESSLRAICTKHAPGLNLKSAERLYDVGCGIAAEYQEIVGKSTAKQYTLPALVTAEPAELSAPARKKQQALFDYVAGTSQKSWLDKMRPAKPDGRGSNPGGFRPNALYLRAWLEKEYPDHPEYLEIEVFTELPKDVQKRYKAEGERYEKRLTKEQKEAIQHAADARAWCEQIAPALTLGIDQEYYLHATDEQLQALHHALGDLYAAVGRAKENRAGNGGKKKALPAK